MSIPGAASPLFLATTGEAAAFEIPRSLRLNYVDSAYLNRTPSSASNQKTWTWSGWVKCTDLVAQTFILAAGSSPYFQLYFSATVLYIELTGAYLATAQVFRDPAAFYHFVLAFDTTQATAANRVKLYVNGSEVTTWTTDQRSSIAQNTDTAINSATQHNIGKQSVAAAYSNMMLAEVNFIDGQALAATDFGETDSNGVWRPKDTSGLTFGTNGYRLQFADNSNTTAATLGKDTSGNSNNFTPTNFSVAAGVNNDSLVDSPTNGTASTGGDAGGAIVGNYSTWNPLWLYGASTYSNGNLDIVTNGTSYGYALNTIGVSSGKYYAEFNFVSGGTYCQFGIASNLATAIGVYLGQQSNAWGFSQHIGGYYTAAGTNSYGSTWSAGDLLAIALDKDNDRLYFAINGTWQNSANPASGTGGVDISSSAGLPAFFAVGDLDGPVVTGSINFGQRAFSNAAPAGFKSLNTANLPTPTIADSSTAMDVVLDTGANILSTAQGAIGGSADLLWIKDRANTNNHQLIDTVRGGTITLQSNTGSGDTTYGAPSGSSVGWTWSAGANSNKTYAITVANPGSGNKYYADGALQPTLTLAEGSTYKFDQSAATNSGHPLRFSTTSDGTHGGGSEYTTGVTTAGTPGSAGAFTQIVIAASAPTLYAYCTNHSGMGFQVNTSDTAGSTIPVGSLNSLAYNFGNWTSMVTGAYSTAHGWGTTYQTANAFDGNLATMVIPDGSQGWTFTPSSSIAGSTIEIYGWNDGCPNNGLVINGNNYGDALGADQTSGQWYTLPYSTLTSIQLTGDGSAGSSEFRLIAIRIDGKMLIQTGTSVTSVPTIASRVKASPENGFSIISYSGNATVGATFGHALNTAPEFAIFKNRDDSLPWYVYHKDIGSTKYLRLNGTIAATARANFLNNTSPTNFVITLGNDAEINATGQDIICYAWTSVSGYSSVGSYTGNGDASGPFVFTGFKPAWILYKRSDVGETDWTILDSTRGPNNVINEYLQANNNNAEVTATTFDFLSNGFKPRLTSAGHNASGGTYVYYAVAQHPFASNGGLAR